MRAEPVTARRIGVGLAVVAALLTAGCAAGQDAQTADEKPTLDGTNASVGAIDLRGLAVEPPAGPTTYFPTGSDLSVRLVLVNNSQQPDQLTSITSPAVSDWGAFASSADADAVMSAQTATPSATPTPPPSAPGSPTPGSSPGNSTPTPTSTPLPTPKRQVKVGPNGVVSWGTPTATGALLLMKTTRPLYPGSSIRITFTFANAGTITVMVPIALSTTPRSSIIPGPTGSGIE